MKEIKQTILIVDDERINIDLLTEIFKKDYILLVAKNGKQSLKILEKNAVDLILLDIIMPEMDGYEVCKQLKENEQTRNIPVVFITGMSEEEDEAKGLELGAVDYIKKPFYKPIVKCRVETHLALKKKSDMLEHLAAIDGLTNLYNRRKFDETILYEWERALRNNSQIALILIDIDDFKKFNDGYGHSLGDYCLKQVAQKMKETLNRSNDFIARYGGEEFIVILPNADIKGATYIASSLKKNVEELNIPHKYSKTSNYVTISLGLTVTTPNQGCKSIAELIEITDKMLYSAKESGRNQFKLTLI
ncbi:MAG: diguanylate cyclase [Desulfobacterales bacterium]|nr:diguanylate cyclase [Desulfobacterales bacterium]MBF0395710.1 diguanylate cyclase [Desulfobacterales bacterium]